VNILKTLSSQIREALVQKGKLMSFSQQQSLAIRLWHKKYGWSIFSGLNLGPVRFGSTRLNSYHRQVFFGRIQSMMRFARKLIACARRLHLL